MQIMRKSSHACGVNAGASKVYTGMFSCKDSRISEPDSIIEAGHHCRKSRRGQNEMQREKTFQRPEYHMKSIDKPARLYAAKRC